MKRALCLLGLALSLFPPAADSAAGRPPAVLLFHEGGFCFGSPQLMDEAAVLATQRGFAPFEVDYPLCDIGAAARAAVAQAQRLRRRGYRVFAYGDSAGGTLAALLAERGLARAAAAAAPPSDLIHWPDFSDQEYEDWFRVTRADRFRLSPAFHLSKRPILVLQGDDGFKEWNRSWAKRDPRVRYRSVPGGHPDKSAMEYRANTALGMDWLRRQVRVR